MLWAASCLCFFGFLRMGEVVVPLDTEFNPMVHLTYQDVQAESTSQPKWIRVWIKASKTDPFHVGITIYMGLQKSGCAQLLRSWHIWYSGTVEGAHCSNSVTAGT